MAVSPLPLILPAHTESHTHTHTLTTHAPITHSFSIMSEEMIIKIAILGDSGVGKTSLLSIYTSPNYFELSKIQLTIGTEYKVITRTVHVGGDRVVQAKVQLWDTAGQEKYKSIIKPYVRDRDVIIFAFEAAKSGALPGMRPASVDAVRNWYKFMEEVPQLDRDRLMTVLVCTKFDLVSTHDELVDNLFAYVGENIMPVVAPRDHDIHKIFPTSAQTGYGVSEMFDQVIAAAVRRRLAMTERTTSPITVVPRTSIVLKARRQKDDDDDDDGQDSAIDSCC